MSGSVVDGVWRREGDLAANGDPIAAERVRFGLWLSAGRCVVTYVVAPVVGLAGVFDLVGAVLQLVAAMTAVCGARALWSRRHPGRYVYVAVAAVIVGSTVLVMGIPVLRVGQGLVGLAGQP